MNEPVYDIREAKRLDKEREFRVIHKAASFLKNHYEGNPSDVILEVFDAISERDFYKSLDLERWSNIRADVYKPVFDGMERYSSSS
jgi:hypothetical protein